MTVHQMWDEANARTKVLVVDDDYTMCDLLTGMLRHEGYTVVGGAHDGEMALEMCSKFRPDVVCLDVDMPRVGGVEALRAIRMEYPETVVIMVSGQADMKTVTEAIREGASAFIVKPFNAAKIFDTVKGCSKRAWRQS